MSSEITPDVKDFILEALMNKPVLHSACRSVGVCPIAVQKAIETDEVFARDIEIAEQIGIGAAEGAAWERAVEGQRSPVYVNGRQQMYIDEEGNSVPLYEYKFSDQLLQLILKSRKPTVYGDKTQVELTGKSVLIAPTTTDMESFREMLRVHRDGTGSENNED